MVFAAAQVSGARRGRDSHGGAATYDNDNRSILDTPPLQSQHESLEKDDSEDQTNSETGVHIGRNGGGMGREAIPFSRKEPTYRSYGPFKVATILPTPNSNTAFVGGRLRGRPIDSSRKKTESWFDFTTRGRDPMV